jgi:hypothetical protein
MKKGLSKKAQAYTLEIVSKVQKKYQNAELFVKVPLDRDPETGESVKEMFEKGLKEAKTREEKEYFKTALKSGVWDRVEEVPNMEVWNKINEEIDAEITKAVESGELPKLSLQIIKKKTRKYVRKHKRSSGETKES